MNQDSPATEVSARRKPAPVGQSSTPSRYVPTRNADLARSMWHMLIAVLCLLLADAALAAGEQRVGSYLYAPPRVLKEFKGSLTIRFAKPGPKLVVAYGYRNRKNRKSRDDTTEEERHRYKPVKAELRDNGSVAVFPHLAPDLYDVFIIVPETMQFFEGLTLYRGAKPADEIPVDRYLEEVGQSLSIDEETSYGWEAFFETKTFERLETDGKAGCVLLQQMRKKPTVAASGAPIAGCIHSIDICWVERTKAEGEEGDDRAWQVITRQQLYREELDSRKFFEHHYLPDLRGILVGNRAKEIGPLKLPDGSGN